MGHNVVQFLRVMSLELRTFTDNTYASVCSYIFYRRFEIIKKTKNSKSLTGYLSKRGTEAKFCGSNPLTKKKFPKKSYYKLAFLTFFSKNNIKFIYC